MKDASTIVKAAANKAANGREESGTLAAPTKIASPLSEESSTEESSSEEESDYEDEPVLTDISEVSLNFFARSRCNLGASI